MPVHFSVTSFSYGFWGFMEHLSAFFPKKRYKNLSSNTFTAYTCKL